MFKTAFFCRKLRVLSNLQRFRVEIERYAQRQVFLQILLINTIGLYRVKIIVRQRKRNLFETPSFDSNQN